MITLKDYQTRVLDSLRNFLRQCSKDGRPEGAFQEAAGSQWSSARAIHPGAYRRVETGDALRLPPAADGRWQNFACVPCRRHCDGRTTTRGTGRRALARAEQHHPRPDRRCPSRPAPSLPARLELACGQVEVVTIEEAIHFVAGDGRGADGRYRCDDSVLPGGGHHGRKVYDQNGSFAEHLLNVPADRLSDLLPGADGKPKPSLVNMLRLRRPVVIMDEATMPARIFPSRHSATCFRRASSSSRPRRRGQRTRRTCSIMSRRLS